MKRVFRAVLCLTFVCCLMAAPGCSNKKCCNKPECAKQTAATPCCGKCKKS